ncbi:unannotated protein [freshwater metagenome]|uniref:Unannotated protein n=1 Tax=freshwater metagenome TaxID=449393 RepID=A0A6J7TYT7_9ZZZZ
MATTLLEAMGLGTAATTKNHAAAENQTRGLRAIRPVSGEPSKYTVAAVAAVSNRNGSACTIAPVTVLLMPWASRKLKAVGALRPLTAINRVKM